MPVVVTVMYPAREGARFDVDYYMATHVPLVESRWRPAGLQRFEALHAAPSAGGPPPRYRFIAQLTFASAAEVQSAMAAHGREIMADVPNFTDIEPQMQVSEQVAVL